jgi:hypothetical protein
MGHIRMTSSDEFVLPMGFEEWDRMTSAVVEGAQAVFAAAWRFRLVAVCSCTDC